MEGSEKFLSYLANYVQCALSILRIINEFRSLQLLNVMCPHFISLLSTLFISLLFVIICCLYLLLKSNQTVEAVKRERKSFIYFCLFSIWLQKPETEKIFYEKNGFDTELLNIYHVFFQHFLLETPESQVFVILTFDKKKNLNDKGYLLKYVT